MVYGEGCGVSGEGYWVSGAGCRVSGVGCGTLSRTLFSSSPWLAKGQSTIDDSTFRHSSIDNSAKKMTTLRTRDKTVVEGKHCRGRSSRAIRQSKVDVFHIYIYIYIYISISV